MKIPSERLESKDWPQAFEIATTWANKNYGGKVATDTVEQAEALITAELGEIKRTTHQPPPAVTPEATASSSRTYAQVLATPTTQYRGPSSLIPPQVSVRPKNNVQHIEVQTSPTLFPHATASNAPQYRGDWSFDDDEEVQYNPLDPQEILRPITLTLTLTHPQSIPCEVHPNS